MLQLIDDETASRYYNEIDTATGDDLQTKMSALESWATAKKADQHRQEWDHVSGVFTDFDNYSAAEGLDAFDEESRYQYANRKFIAHQTGGKFEDQIFVYPSKRDEVTDQMFGKVGLSEKEAFNLFKGAVESRKASEEALRELPGVLAQGVLKRAGEGKEFDEVDSWFAFDGWKQRHADKLGAMPAGWETAMLDSAVKLHARTEALMADVAPESKRAMDVLMKFTRPEDAADLPEAGRTDVENLAKDFAKLTPEQRDGIYATLSYAAEAGGAGLGKGFWEKVGEGVARGGVNIYDDAAMTAEDRQARQNISFFQDLLDKPQSEPDRMQTADSIQMQRDMAQRGLEENKQRLAELRVMREIRDLAQGRIDPIKTEMDGVLGSVVQGAYDFSQSAAYTGMAMIPYVGLPAVMGALANSNYLRMLDEYPDMDADAAYNLSLAIAGPQAVVERFQGGLLLGKLPYLNQAMKRLTDARVPLPARLGLGYAGVVGAETVTELAQEAMPVVADQIASAVREDMPEFDSEKAWGEYREQAPKIFYSMLWGGLIGGGAVGIRELDRSGVFLRNVQELEMHGITGEVAQNIAAEQDPDAATTMFREAWDKRSPEDIQAGIAKRAAMLDAAQATQANPDLPTRRVEQAPDGTTTHIIEQNGQAVYRTSDPAAADMALINITRMMDRSRITGTTTGIVESLQFIDQVNQATNRGEDVQKLLLDGAPRTLLDDYEANPTEQNLDNLFATVRAFGQDISEPAELANFPVLASNQGALAEGIFKSVIRIQDGATGVEVMRDFSQDNLKRAIAENRVTMDWVREQLNQVIPLIESDRLEGRRLRTETDTDVIESFSDVAVAYMNGRIRDEQVPAGFRGFLRRMAIVVKDIFRRAYRLKRAIAEGKVDTNFESFLAESVGLNQQTLLDTTRERVSNEVLTDTSATNFSIGSPAFQNWFGDSKAVNPDGKPMVVYHGTQRPDRVGTRFRKSRATSGPMAFFTNDPAIASSYSTNKSDTSAEMPSDYAGWFKWKGKGMRSPVNIDQAWWNLSEAERATIKERIYTVGYSNADEYTGPIIADSQSIMSRDSIDYELRQARGNAIRALVEMWLSSGSLFNQEEKFLEVLQAAGVKGATLDDPNAVRSAVYPVYLSIKNPLDTASIPENVVAALDQASKGKRAKQAKGGNPDAWDKNTISGKDWMAALKEDIANGTTYAWTRIPDWATQTLTSLGYDGIKDKGGKYSGESHQVWIPFNETQIKSATGNRGTFDPTSPNINYSIGLSKNTISQVSDKEDASRVGTSKLGTNKKPQDTPQDSNVSGENVPDDLLAKQMEKMNYAHLPKNILSEKDPKKKRRKLVNWFKKNLLALHDAFPEEFRARATHWYDGANRIAKEMGSQFKATVEQASGVIAVFSPQKDWFMNVAQAEQFMELWTNSQDVVLEESLVRAEIEGIIQAATVADKQKRKKVSGETKEQTAERREYNKALDKLEKEKRRKIVEQVIGKTIRQLDAEPDLQGWAIRVLAQVTFGRNYRNLSPEGDRLGMATNDDGALSKNGWGSINEIEKAVRIMKDGSLKNISNNLGNEHKVRNFYNNIVAPNSPFGDATIDTHAVAAAHLMPYGAKATEVGHNFGSGMNGSEVLGISGVYHLYLDAYREAAAERGILPRQMQSITWEAIRLVYPAANKNAAALAKSQETWKSFKDDIARNTLVGGRIPSPVWAGTSDNRESQGISSGLQKDGGRNVSGGSLLSGVRPTGAGRDGGLNYSISSQSEIDRVNRALGGMNRGPDERLKVYERAREKFFSVMQRNKEELDAIRSTVSTDTAPAIEQIEMDRAGSLADIEAEENAEVAKALQDNADTFMPRIEAAQTPAERKRVERDAKDRAKILEQGIRDKYAERKKTVESQAKAQRDQVLQAAAAKDSAANARMRDKVRQTKLLNAIGELDGILSVLPPEVRGRVGGFAVLANIGTGDKALADFFVKRIDMIDRELEKVVAREYRESISKLLSKSLPTKSKAGVMTSTLGPEAADYVKKAYAASLLDQDAAIERMQEIQGRLEEETDSKKIQDLAEEWGIVHLFGSIDTSDSLKLAGAYETLKSVIKEGRSKWKMLQEARRAEIKKLVQTGVDKLGQFTPEQIKLKTDKESQDRLRNIKEGFNRHLAPFQLLETLFGADHPITVKISRELRLSTNEKNRRDLEARKGIDDAARVALGFEPGQRGMKVRWEIDKALESLMENKTGVKAFTGRRVRSVRIPVEMAEKIVRGEVNLKSVENKKLDDFEDGIIEMTGTQLPRLTDAHIQTIREELGAHNERMAERAGDDPNATPVRGPKYITIDLLVFEGVLGDRTMTPFDAMHYLATWRQADGRAHMERNGFTEQSVEQMEQLVTPFARAMFNEMLRQTGNGYDAHNRIYSALYGVNMPRVQNHFPLVFQTQEKEQGGMRLPGEKSGSGGMMPGHIKARTKHQAELRQVSMAEVFWRHTESANYWIAFAETVRDMRAVLLNPELQKSITGAYGEAAAQQVKDMVQIFTDGGVEMKNRVYERIYNNIVGAVATASLGFRLSSIVNQNDASLRFMLGLTPRQQGRAIASLAAGDFSKKYTRAWNSPTVQTRLEKGVNPLVRMMNDNALLPSKTTLPELVKKFLPEKLASSAEGGLQNTLRALGILRDAGFMPMQLTDSALTSFSASVVYENAYIEAKEQGLSDAEADRVAADKMDEITFRTVQPTELAQKSLVENMATTWKRGLMQFMSDQRLKFSIWGSALRGLAKGEGDRSQHIQTLIVLGFMGLVNETLRAWYRDFFTDDDDEEIYKASNWVRAFAVGPVSGFWFYGTIMDTMIRSFLGERTFGMAGQLDSFLKDMERISKNPEPLFDWSDESRSLSAWKSAARVAGGIYPPAQAVSLPLNIIEPILGAASNAENED